MSKPIITMAAIGGAFVLLAGGMVYLIWNAHEEKVSIRDGDNGYTAVLNQVESYFPKSDDKKGKSDKPVTPVKVKISPTQENIDTLIAQKKTYDAWRTNATQLVVKGDRTYPKTTSAAMKEFLMNDAKRLSALPGGVEGALTQPEFGYGPFREYISEGKLPAEDQLPTLQRQWDDIATVIEMLSKCGISEVTDVAIKPQEKPKEEPKVRRNQPKSSKNKQKKQTKTADQLAKVDATSWTYILTFNTRPAGFVKALNALETCERFVVVEDFAITRLGDMIQDAINAEKKKEELMGGRRRASGRRAAVIEEDPADAKLDPALLAAKKSGIITDPTLEMPVQVVLTYSVYDFGTKEETPEAPAAKADAATDKAPKAEKSAEPAKAAGKAKEVAK